MNMQNNLGSVEWQVPLSAVAIGPAEIAAAVASLRSGWLTSGPELRKLEQEFAARIGTRHAVAVSSGTAALELSLRALGVAPGDEVITPSLTFVAAANSILRCGAVPRFCDVSSLQELLVSVETLDRVRNPKTRGICVMHYGGYPCPMDRIMEYARRHGLWVVEDAAHAPGASYQSVALGAWGDTGCFSFFGNKNITCGEGGMVVTSSDDVAARIRSLRSHGMDSPTWDRHRGHRFSYDVTEPGSNFRLDDLRAAVLRAQLLSLDSLNLRRKERVGWYREMLRADSRWIIPFDSFEGESAFHLFVLVLDPGIPRDRIMDRMKGAGVQTSIHYPPVHRFACYRGIAPPGGGLEVTEALGERLLTLPLFADLTRDQVAKVCCDLRAAAQ